MSIGNKDLKFINERRFYLERFLKKLSQFPFLINSWEFQCFARPSGDIEKNLNAIPKLSTGDVEKLRSALEINERLYQQDKQDGFDT